MFLAIRDRILATKSYCKGGGGREIALSIAKGAQIRVLVTLSAGEESR